MKPPPPSSATSAATQGHDRPPSGVVAVPVASGSSEVDGAVPVWTLGGGRSDRIGAVWNRRGRACGRGRRQVAVRGQRSGGAPSVGCFRTRRHGRRRSGARLGGWRRLWRRRCRPVRLPRNRSLKREVAQLRRTNCLRRGRRRSGDVHGRVGILGGSRSRQGERQRGGQAAQSLDCHAAHCRHFPHLARFLKHRARPAPAGAIIARYWRAKRAKTSIYPPILRPPAPIPRRLRPRWLFFPRR
jgi:hypothetical protein